MKQTFLGLALLLTLFAGAQEISIIPRPSKMEAGTGNFTITNTTKIILAGSGMEKSARFLNDYLQKFYGFHLQVQKKRHIKK